MDILKYKEEVTADIQACIERLGRRPILFIGSGASIRYSALPDWVGLLDLVRNECPTLDKGIAYYIQSYDGDLPAIATAFCSAFHDYAWTDEGRAYFPAELFSRATKKDAYFKHSIARVLAARMAAAQSDSSKLQELEALSRINPFSIITTNYDSHLQGVFSRYHVTVGEQVFTADLTRIGDLLKIHGCISDPSSLVITKEDYEEYKSKRRYLSAKLLTYFLEHPIIFIGYSVNDENIRDILADVDLVLSKKGALIENIYVLSYITSTPEERDVSIPTVADRYIRVKHIQATDFAWVYDALAFKSPIDVNIGILRDLESTILKLTRSDIPTGRMNVNYDTLTRLGSKDEETLKLIGLGPLTNITQSRIHYRYTLSQVAKLLGYSYWHWAQVLIDKVKQETGFDIKGSDNIYHSATHYGKGVFHEYSDAAVSLLSCVRDCEPYVISDF